MGWIYFVSTCTEEGDGMHLFHFAILLHVRMAEWSKAPDSRINPCSLIRNKLETSGPRPTSDKYFFCLFGGLDLTSFRYQISIGTRAIPPSSLEWEDSENATIDNCKMQLSMTQKSRKESMTKATSR